MSLVLIKTFLAIVETGSLVNASQSLNITQSTVTARLKSLEQDVGQTLIYRLKSGVALTSSGVKFHRYAEAINNMWHQAVLESSMPEGMESICNLGCDYDLWPHIGRSASRVMRHRHPATALTVHQADSQRLGEWLGLGNVDAALSYRQFPLPGLTAVELQPERLELYSTQPDTPVRSDPGYIYFDAGAEFGSQHAAEYADAGVAKHTFGSARSALDYLLDCGGSCYLPTPMAQNHLASGRLHALPSAPAFSRRVFLITNNTALPNWPWLPELVLSTSHQA